MKFLNNERVGELHLLACVVCFGISFVIQRLAATNPDRRTVIGPLTYNALRYVVSTVITIMLMPTLRRAEEREKSKLQPLVTTSNREKSDPKDPHSPAYYLWLYGGISGTAGFFGSNGQQVGLMHVSVAKTAFITSMFVIVIPVVESLLPGGRMAHSTWVAAIVSIVGTYYVSGMAESGHAGSAEWSETHGMSEMIIFVSMLFWAISIMVSDRGCKKCNCMALTAIDFFVVTVLSLMAAFIFEPHEWIYPFTRIRLNLLNICTVGTTEAAGFLFCALGQIVVSSSRTALILSLEALSGAFFGYLFLNETLTPLEMLGCVIMSSAFVVSAEEWDLPDAQRWFNAAWANWWYGSGSGGALTSKSSSAALFSYELLETGEREREKEMDRDRDKIRGRERAKTIEASNTPLVTSALLSGGAITATVSGLSNRPPPGNISTSLNSSGIGSSNCGASGGGGGVSSPSSIAAGGISSSSNSNSSGITNSLRGVDIPTLLGYSVDTVAADKHH